jgi:hypothetical protein
VLVPNVFVEAVVLSGANTRYPGTNDQDIKMFCVA